MQKLRAWISAARLRTLPLSISGIIVGTALAIKRDFFEGEIFIFAILTTLSLQILSNFANDYGDGIKGTDNETRTGPMRALQSGIISPKEMKTGVIAMISLTLVCTVSLIYFAFEDTTWHVFLYIFLGICAIAAAIKYTVGKSAYGYQGLGDIFVFIFFGLVSVVGVFFLYAKFISILIFLPAFTVGMLSTAVLNLNNMRDIVGDKKSGKITLAVRLGKQVSKNYHFLLIIGAFLTTLLYVLLTGDSYKDLLCFIAFIPLFVHLNTVAKTKEPKALDPEMKKVTLSTVLFSLLFLVQYLFF